MKNGRVDRAAYITGVGVVSPIGVSRKAFWSSLLANESGVGPITLFDPEGFEVKIAAECTDFEPKDFMDRKAAQRTDRFAQLGLGGVASIENTQRTMDERGPARVNPFAVTKIMPNSAAAHVGIQLGVQGPSAAPAL